MTHAERLRKYRAENKDRLNAHMRERWANDPELRARISAYRKQYRRADPEKYKCSPSRHPEYRRAWELQREFGLTVVEYNAMLQSQGGVCAICKKTQNNGRRLAVDHNHATGKVRGLLCYLCNKFLGRIEDDSEAARRAAAYLEAAR